MNEASVKSDFDIPVFAPSLNEFRDFKTYVTKLERFYGKFGMVKVSTIFVARHLPLQPTE